MIDDEDELKKWDEICEYMACTRATAIKIAKQYNAPIIKLGGKVFTTKQKMDVWLDYLFEFETYSIVKAREQAISKKKRDAKNENKD